MGSTEARKEHMKQTTRSIYGFLLGLAVLITAPSHVHAAGFPTSGLLTNFGDIVVDKRVVKLKAYLDTHDSPLKEHAASFIEEADRYNVDWRLVAAIAGTESTFGKHIPGGSYNAWGWGIPTGAQSGIAFKSWKDAITQISAGLRKNYLDKGAVSVEQIGRIYAASPAWSWKVHFFMDQIETFSPNSPELLSVTL